MRALAAAAFYVGVAFVLVLPTAALAWGPEGHAIVAAIAEARLTPAAAAVVRQLLAADTPPHEHLDQVASWADDYRDSHPETAAWHFVAIPLETSGYDAVRNCADGNCLVARIQRFAATPGNVQAPMAERVEALKFVVNLVGDIHQPLQCENNNDHSGHDLQATYLGQSTNLRAIWNRGIIEAALDVRLGPQNAPDPVATRAMAGYLNHLVTPAIAAGWVRPGAVARLDIATPMWADDSFRIARQAYRGLPDQRAPGWDQAYQAAEWPVVETQLAKAGVRLAALLNEELR